MSETDIERAIKKIYAWMVAGGLAVAGVGGSGVLRVDKFTESDAELMRAEIMLEIKKVQSECQRQIRKSEDNKPPGPTKQRIIACEQCCRRVDPEYEQPTWLWY